jgi:probable phosphoglycerate mutase
MTGAAPRPRTRAPKDSTADITLVFDGGSLGNPGKGYGSALLRGIVTTPRPVRLEFEGRKTNNEAEYLTMIRGLQLALRQLEDGGNDPGAASIHVLSDSKLVVEQVNGRWKVRHEGLKPLHREAQAALARFGRWSLMWQPRSESVRLLGH